MLTYSNFICISAKSMYDSVFLTVKTYPNFHGELGGFKEKS